MTDTAACIDHLRDAIRALPGDKLLTLLTSEHYEPLVVEVDAAGVFGPGSERDLLFRTRLAVAFRHAGGLIVRQLLPVSIQRRLPDGRVVWIPRKNVYGISIAQGSWMALTKEEMRWAHRAEARSGRPMAAEKDVSFRDFPL